MYCRPNSDSITGLTGAVTLSGISFTATGSAITISSNGSPVTSGTSLTGLSPYNTGTCSGAGVNATSLATNQPYTGLSVTITNNSSAPVTISIYIDSIASGGQFVQRVYTFPEIPKDNNAHAYNLTWESSYTDGCVLPSGSTFDQTKINGIGFGVATTTASVTLELSMSNIQFTGGGATNPCAGLCTSPATFAVGSGTSSFGNIGVTAKCWETTSNFVQGNCGNFVSPRTLSINGTAVNCASGAPAYSPPAKRNGGYCFQVPAGQYDYAYWGVW
jgi:hypothetical protein